MLTLELLGPMSLSNAGVQLALPSSRKTRALLAYLAVTGREHSRDRLCEMFWSVPDDPRGALRWSLSKIRGLGGESGQSLVIASRESVALDVSSVVVDVIWVKRLMAAGIEQVGVEDLRRALAAFRGTFLADVELPDCHAFRTWSVALREDLRRMQLGVLNALASRLPPPEALTFAREMVRIDPCAELSWVILLRLLVAAGRSQEGEQQYEIGRAALAAGGSMATLLTRTWREMGDNGFRPPIERDSESRPTREAVAEQQKVQFCTANDGVRIAYATVGRGPPLVKPANWMTHLEYDWHSPIWRHWIRELARDHTLIRYDERANGLSDWDVADLSFEACMRDLEAIVDATGLKRFPMLGISQGCAFALCYAVRHPERVSHLILYGGYARGWAMRGSSPDASRREAMGTLIEHGWGQDNPAFRQVFTTLFVPDATPEQMRWFNDLQRTTASPANALRLHHTFGQVQVEALLPLVSAPTLVLHSHGDGVVPFDEGRRLASAIPGARFVPLDGRNHILLEDETAWIQFLSEVRAFLAG